METIDLTLTFVSIYSSRSLYQTPVSADAIISEMGKTSHCGRAKPGNEPHCQHTCMCLRRQVHASPSHGGHRTFHTHASVKPGSHEDKKFKSF